ncbi:TetR/AcrR family transcriptional regulator [Solirubrobacter phytolaccae]|uniref:TetR/AcrR family transcriptional regulator n=1 Tax=Solirubrobacter phytolaccae TaxID=1404360 RepID=A0A9X3NEV4_9ACTN|nr:TetR/AcrR family transcriptional regulator [Solirubrobacter phytolaccae]MDA0183682.1 TetR/AcrR family transcriptional regulator [Solirubrobacter phytolaccae]
MGIARWKPNARERLQEVALELFAERGYEQTTAAEIAARAELTERTFFRHFTDKREVLFAGEAAMQAALVAGVADATGDEFVRAGLEAVADELEPRRDDLRRRAALIASHPALRERELIKQAATAEVLADALRERGVAAGEAEVSAEVAIVLLRVAFDRWLAAGDGSLRERVAEVRGQLVAVR